MYTYTINQLDKAFDDFLSILNYPLDTFTFRKGYETAFNLSEQEKKEISTYLERKVPLNSVIYRKAKRAVDQAEFLATDYYQNHSAKFRGSYRPVVMRTIGGVIALSL